MKWLAVIVSALVTAGTARVGFSQCSYSPSQITVQFAIGDNDFNTSGAGLTLVGTNSAGEADPNRQLKVRVLLAGQFPLANADVGIGFPMGYGHAVCETQPFTSATCHGGALVSMGGVTNQDGVLVFRVVGSGTGNPDLPFVASLSVCAQTNFSQFPLAALDLDGGGLSSSDLSRFYELYFDDEYHQIIDYNFNLGMDSDDLSIWLSAYFGGDSANGCDGATCD